MGRKNTFGIIIALIVVLIVGSLTVVKTISQEDEFLIPASSDIYSVLYIKQFLRKNDLGNYFDSYPVPDHMEGINLIFRIGNFYWPVKYKTRTFVVRGSSIYVEGK